MREAVTCCWDLLDMQTLDGAISYTITIIFRRVHVPEVTWIVMSDELDYLKKAKKVRTKRDDMVRSLPQLKFQLSLLGSASDVATARRPQPSIPIRHLRAVSASQGQPCRGQCGLYIVRKQDKAALLQSSTTIGA